MVEKIILIKELNYFLKIHIKMKIPRWVMSKSLNLKDKDFFHAWKWKKLVNNIKARPEWSLTSSSSSQYRNITDHVYQVLKERILCTAIIPFYKRVFFKHVKNLGNMVPITHSWKKTQWLKDSIQQIRRWLGNG